MSRFSTQSSFPRHSLITHLMLGLFALMGLILAAQWQTPISKSSSDFIDPSIPQRFEQTMERWN